MYRLMKSERYVLEDLVSGSKSSYRHSEVNRYRQASEAVTACKLANSEDIARHYVLNDRGQEYFGGVWID
jgi:hypothetical protein